MNFFEEKTATKVRVKKFDMQDENDLMWYERIHNKIHVEKAEGWDIITEDKFSDKFCNVYILLKWKEPNEYGTN